MAVIVRGWWIPSGFTERDGVLPHPPCACRQLFLDTFGTPTILEWWRLGSPLPGGCRGDPACHPCPLAGGRASTREGRGRAWTTGLTDARDSRTGVGIEGGEAPGRSGQQQEVTEAEEELLKAIGN